MVQSAEMGDERQILVKGKRLHLTAAPPPPPVSVTRHTKAINLNENVCSHVSGMCSFDFGQ